MDDQKQPFNQLNNQPKDDQDADVSSSAPVEMEPSTKGPSMGTMPSQPGPAATPPLASQPPVMPEQPGASMTPVQDADHLLEAPHKKSALLIATVVIVLIIALGLMGLVVYQALY